MCDTDEQQLKTDDGGGSLKKRPPRMKPPDMTARQAFWVSCRTAVMGLLLLLLGMTMSTVGYFNEYFAKESLTLAENVTMLVVNGERKLQFQTMTYIGPVVMGAGAFMLMMACVTTCESRDKRARLRQQQLSQLAADFPSRRSTVRRAAARVKSNPEQKQPLAGKTAETGGGGGLAAVAAAAAAAAAAASSDLNANQVLNDGNNNNRNDAGHQPVELIGVGNGGVINRCFTRDDSKSASRPDTDSNPFSTTTTTTLTWSKNGGPRCEAEPSKFPSSSSGIGQAALASAAANNSAANTADAKALLQRFLEDQSQLVEDRLTRQPLQPTKLLDESRPLVNGGGGNSRPSSSSDISGWRARNVIAAEVHQHSNGSETATAAPLPSRGNLVTLAKSRSRPRPPPNSLAPVIAPDALECFSPMNLTPDTPPSEEVTPRHRPLVNGNGSVGGGDPTQVSNANYGQSVNGSFVTVADDLMDGQDSLNGNVGSNAFAQRSQSVRHSGNGSKTKLYDSVFLAENLRLMASNEARNNRSAADLTAMPCKRPSYLFEFDRQANLIDSSGRMIAVDDQPAVVNGGRDQKFK